MKNLKEMLPEKVIGFAAKTSAKLQKESPHIFFGVGLVGIGVGTVMACRATLKASDALDSFKEEVEGVKTDLAHTPGYKRDLAHVYIKNTTHLARLYAPSIIVMGTSIGLLTTSHVQLNNRNKSLTIAYAALHKAFDEYRERVREEVGEEKERDLYFAAETVEVESDGTKILAKVVDPNKLSPYARIFDESSPEWKNNAEMNRLFIQANQNYMNHRLQVVGHVFLNEVYDQLGFERTSAGQVVGWVISDDPDHSGDNYIDFDMFDAANSRFINGYEKNVVLDFNVDGVIVDKI